MNSFFHMLCRRWRSRRPGAAAGGCARWLHRRIREDWGFPDPPEMTMQERFTSRYRGKRYSFGYPACPNLEDHAGLSKLLRPEEIGVQLTEGFMMDPEASVSALVFHHPDCTYFSVGAIDTECTQRLKEIASSIWVDSVSCSPVPV